MRATSPALMGGMLAFALTACSSTIERLPVNSLDNTSRLPVRVWEPSSDVSTGKGIVLLHGCSGWSGGNIGLWANWFNARGYVAVAVDSFGPRGVSSNCTNKKVGVGTRAVDAYSALHHLIEEYGVDSENVLVMGFSDGAQSAIQSMSPGLWRVYFNEGDPRFAGAIAFYPPCAWLNQKVYGPIQVVAAGADDWTPVNSCFAWVERISEGAEKVSIHVIPGATHAFDQFRWGIHRVYSRTYLGHTLTPSVQATEEAKTVVSAFLERL